MKKIPSIFLRDFAGNPTLVTETPNTEARDSMEQFDKTEANPSMAPNGQPWPSLEKSTNTDWVVALALAFKAEGYTHSPLVPEVEAIRRCLKAEAFMQELRFLLLSNGFWFDEMSSDPKTALLDGFRKAFEKLKATSH